MVGITEADIDATIGPIDRIIMDEIIRTGASRLEFRRAFAMARGRADFKAASTLPPHMQRLVDLLAVALPEQGPALPRDHAEKGIGRAA